MRRYIEVAWILSTGMFDYLCIIFFSAYHSASLLKRNVWVSIKDMTFLL